MFRAEFTSRAPRASFTRNCKLGEAKQARSTAALPSLRKRKVTGLLALFPVDYAYFSPPYFVGWGTLALINAGLAQGKKKSGLLWFLQSLLLGPVATLLIVLF